MSNQEVEQPQILTWDNASPIGRGALVANAAYLLGDRPKYVLDTYCTVPEIEYAETLAWAEHGYGRLVRGEVKHLPLPQLDVL